MGFFTKFFLLPSSASLVIPVSVVTTNTNLSNELVLATYQSYILDTIADEAYNDYNLKTIYFENDKEVFNGFASGAFDLAVLSSSTLEEAIDKGLVRQIDWKRFNGEVKSKLGLNVENRVGQENGQLVTKLGELYSPVIKEFFSKNNKLATHGVPYFLSYLAFAYSGDKKLGNGDGASEESNSTTMKPMGWKELIQKITQDERFKTQGDRPRLGMVEDELTLFSLSKLSSQDSQEGEVTEITNLFKDKENKKSEKEFFDSFMKINAAGIKKGGEMGSRPIFFSPDSVVLSDALNDGTLNGVFFYNGDALYAHTLTQEDSEDEDEKEEEEEESDSEEKQIHIVPLNPALWLLDSIAISAKASEEKLDTIYKFLEKISFGDLDKLNELQVQKTLEADDEEGQEEEREVPREEAKNKKAGWLIKNYKEILYTPALKTFNQWIKGKLRTSEGGGGGGSSSNGEEFYKKEKEFLYGNPDIEECLEKQTQTRVKRSPESQQCNISIVFERGLSDAQNLNLTMAFERWKNGF
ncbi:spermidine/putrescine ABC transporter substrate-binding protein [Mycoplasma wenyonii str. Massachusetts]|uniref:Spermidine/putrescine ABC transporter substrate-binding protein n=1 Tax=Mycoplasma wenyonii (strain Massachusetts) TaxID=1197325 RepID=I6ZIS5_MYCWM|nr:spermidine/putrescine ABC transporter substrate-binding protein [Mycoplasma wenyonii]AFN65100.1 spermidine/putrescine ABC transporter substrate-binding protein [Mycoplasma wenyonii str. Massachusetts]